VNDRTTGYVCRILLIANLIGCGKEAPVLDPQFASRMRIAHI